MKVTVQLHNGDKRTYEQADHVEEKEKNFIYIYGEDNRVLAILNNGEINDLHTEEMP